MRCGAGEVCGMWRRRLAVKVWGFNGSSVNLVSCRVQTQGLHESMNGEILPQTVV